MDEGIQTILHVALSDDVKKETGKFFSFCRVWRPPKNSQNKEFCDEVWKLTEQYVSLGKDDNMNK